MKALKFIVIPLIVLCFVIIGCSKQEKDLPLLGFPQEGLKTNTAHSLNVAKTTLNGKTVKIRLKYDAEKTSDKKFYRNFIMGSGSSSLAVYVAIGPYDEILSNVRSGDEFLVYGRAQFELDRQKLSLIVD